MNPGTLRAGAPDRSGARADHRFSVAGLFLALALALVTPALVSAVSLSLTGLSIDAVLGITFFVVALGLFAVSCMLTRRLEPSSSGDRHGQTLDLGPRQLEDRVARELSLSLRAKMPLSIVMIDVEGGSAQPLVNEVLESTCRSRDVIARAGGELVLMLPRTQASEARILAERFRARLADRRRAQRTSGSERLTVSIGICDLASLEDQEPQLLLEAARRALRASRQSGGNRVEIGNGRRRPRGTATVIPLDPRRRGRKKGPRRTSV